MSKTGAQIRQHEHNAVYEEKAKEAEGLESKAQEYLAEAAKYEHYAENYQRTSDSYEDYANRLDYYSNRCHKYLRLEPSKSGYKRYSCFVFYSYLSSFY
jgi:hypothetical protein